MAACPCGSGVTTHGYARSVATDRVSDLDWERPGLLTASLFLAIVFPPIGLVLGGVMWAKGQRAASLVLIVVTVLSALAWLNVLVWHHEIFRRWQDVDQLPSFS